MKRNFKLIAAVLVLAVMALTLASCEYIEGTVGNIKDSVGNVIDKIVPHEHEFSADWSSDETNHWHAAICDKKDECASATADLAAHTFADGVCSVCGYKAEEEAPHEHVFVDGKCECGEADPNYVPPCTEHAYSITVTKEATCTEDGEKTLTCTVCGHSETQTVAPLGHEEKTIEGTAPTCTDTGLSKGKVCSVCGETLTAQSEIAALGHNFVEGACSVCGEVDPNYNGPDIYVFESSTLEKFEAGAKADGETELVGTDGFFKLIYSVKTKVDDTSNKQWEDGYEIGADKVNRLAWAASSFVNDEEEGTKNVVEITVDGTATIKVWWICGGEGRQVAIYNPDGTILKQTEITGAKNSPYLAEFTIDVAGTYYIGNVGGSNYFIKLEAAVTPAEEEPKNEIKVETTDTYTSYNLDFFTFTATAEGYYTFKVPAGLGVLRDGANAPEIDFYNNANGAEFTIGLEAEQEVIFWVSAMTKDMWTIEWSFEAGEVENQPDTPIDGDATELVVGSNNLVFADGELSQGKTYPFTVTEEGTYTFRSDLMAVVMDAEGNTLGRGQVSLTPGTYSVTFFSMMPLPSNSFVVNITFEAPATGEPDGSEEYPFVWETLPESVTFVSDNMNMVYYVFTATADGSVTFTWAVEGNDWFNYFELVDGMTTANNASGYAQTSHTFVVEAGKTYRVGLGTWNEGGETVVTIAFVACAHEWSEATCQTLSTCAKCGATTGDYADHIPNSENPTCGDPAECTVCGTEVGYIPHSWDEGVVTQQPDCSTETNGSMLLTCTVCGATQVEDIWVSHDWVVDEQISVTCTEDGYYKAHCSVCNKIEEYTTEAEGHYNWYAACGETTTCMECGTEFTKNHEGSPATCTEPMYCYNCWEYVGEPAGHQYTYPCDKICSVCYEETNPNATHTIVHVEAKAATCYEDGNVEHWYCSDCGIAWADEALTQQTNLKNVVTPMGHAPATHVAAKAATCTEKGNIEYWLCEACGQAWLDEACTQNTNVLAVVLPTIDHDYVDGICSVCDAVDPNHYFVVSISDALAAADGKKVQVSGTVSVAGAWNSSYGNMNVTIVDADGNELYIYRLATEVALGDIITVKGVMATYNDARQIAQGGTATIEGHDSRYDVIPEVTIPDAIKADDGTNVVVTGTVVKINGAWNSSYGNMNVTIADENGNELYVYRLATNVALNDIIKITGSMGTYGGARQIAEGSTAEIVGTHTCSNYSAATCLSGPKCVVCGTVNGDAIDHNYVDGVCSGCGAAEGVETVSESLDIAASTGTYDSTAKTITWASTGFTFVNAQASSTSSIRTSDTDHFRAYAKSETTISGSKITKIVITCTSSSYASACAGSLSTTGVTATVNGSVVTITVDSGTVDSVVITATAQWRLSKIEVTYQK